MNVRDTAMLEELGMLPLACETSSHQNEGSYILFNPVSTFSALISTDWQNEQYRTRRGQNTEDETRERCL